MRIADLRLFTYHLPFVRQLMLGGKEVEYREGAVVKVTMAGGAYGYGEIAPLPQFSRESLAQCLDEISSLGTHTAGEELPSRANGILNEIDRWPGVRHLSPSARFGFESAILYAAAMDRGITLAGLLSDSPAQSVPVNALLTDMADVTSGRIDRLLEEGFTAFKLKIGYQEGKETTRLVAEVLGKIGERAMLRLDANRSMTVDEALALFSEINEYRIEYIEEPVKNLNQLRVVLKDKRWRIPVALDESLREIQPRDLSLPYGLAAIVIKPTLLGLSRSLEFARVANENDITVVFSSAFESSLGTATLVELAAAVNGAQQVPAGLGTLEWLSSDLIIHPLQITKGYLDTMACARVQLEIAVARLSEV